MSFPAALWTPWVLVMFTHGRETVIWATFPTEGECYKALRAYHYPSNTLSVCRTENSARALWPELFGKSNGPSAEASSHVLIGGSMRPGAGARLPQEGNPIPQGVLPPVAAVGSTNKRKRN